MPKPKHILVIRLSAMGDVAMTVPVLKAFTEQFPEVKITVLTRAFFTPFFRDLKNVEIFSADLNGKHKGVYGLYKLSKELKRVKIDAIADLHNVLRSKILNLFLKGITCVPIDKGRAEKKALISGQKFEQLKTTHQRYAVVFENLGYKIDLSRPSFPKPVVLNHKILELTNAKSGKWIGIAPFAAHESKMYSLNLMEEVIKTLSTNYKILLFGGGKKEVEQLDRIQNKFENVISLAGKLALSEELNVVSNLDLMLSMDSGNAHIAAMLGIEVVTLWGVTHPFAGFYPFHQNIENALLANRNEFPKIPTSVYGNKFPEGYEKAISTISSKAVVSKIENLLQAK